MPSMPSGMRPRFTSKVFLFLVVDVIGMLLFATGLYWLVHGQWLFVRGFPNGPIEATTTTAAGVLLMVWAGAQLLRQFLTRPDGDA